MSDKFTIVICHTISSLEVNEGKEEGESPLAGTTERQKARSE